MTQPTQEQVPPPPDADPARPPATPRPITPSINRRAWTEPSVRVWWFMAIAVLIVFVAYAADRLWERDIERRLIRDGAVIQATMLGNSTKSIRGQTFVPGDIIEVQFDWDGTEYKDSGPIHSPTAVGQPVTIHVDRSDPKIWTDLTETEPLLASMFVGFLFLPIAPIVLVIARMKQRNLRAQWERGEAAPAVVHERKQTPVAPLSYALRCSLRDQRDKRVFTVYVPQSSGKQEEGQTVWVILSPERKRAIAALWFV